MIHIKFHPNRVSVVRVKKSGTQKDSDESFS